MALAEGPVQYPEQPTEELAARFGALKVQTRHMASVSPEGKLHVPDLYQRAFFESLDSHLGNPDFPIFNQLVADDLRTYIDRWPINVANLYLRKDQDFILRSEGAQSTYPFRFDRPQSWDSYFTTLEVSPGEQERFVTTSRLNVQTNFPDRGALVKLAALLMDRTEPQHMLDVGCSRNLIAKKLAYPFRKHFPYQQIEVVSSVPTNGVVNVNRQASSRLMALLNANNFPVASSIGIDIQDMLLEQEGPEADLLRAWGRHSYYPSEYKDRQQVWNFDLLEDQKLPSVKFFQGDITDFDHERFEHDFPDEKKADIAYMATVAYQLGAAGVKAALSNIRERMKPDGVVMVTDFVEISPDGEMEFSPDWPPYSYRHYILDLAREEEGWKELFTVESGRARRVVLTPYAGRLALRRGVDLVSD